MSTVQASVQAAQPTAPPSLAGSWVGRVARPSGTVGAGFHFTSDGVVFLLTGGTGVGTWSADGSKVSYTIKEAILDGDGVFQGHVEINQSGLMTGGKTLSTSGFSHVYDVAGALVRSVDVRITAVRHLA